ncbi:MAG: OstA family protein [Chitinophagaceae bacterium]|nr:OstA family protein [Chitinophagaceae bacterium]
MLKKLFSYFITAICFVIVSNEAIAQVPSTALSAGDSTGKKLEILEAKRYNFQKKDSVGDFVSLAGNVRIRQYKTLFYCDSAVLDQKQNIVEAFGNIHINDEDSVHIYSEYLKYYGREKDAILKNKVKLTDGKGVLTTNELHYNTITKVGTYVNGGKVVTGSTVLTSTEGIYYGETRDIYFKKKVVMVDPEFRVTTDTLLYNTFTEIARFTVPTVIKNKQRTITTSEGYYDMKNKKAVFGKRPVIDDKDYTLTADDIAIDESSGFGDALGHAVYKSKDTANPSIIIANRLQSNNKTNALLATQKPVMIIRQGADSIYIAADTLYTARLSDLRTSRYVPSILQFNIETATIETLTKSQADSAGTTAIAQAKNAAAARNTLGSIGKGKPRQITAKDSTMPQSSMIDSLPVATIVKTDTTGKRVAITTAKKDTAKTDSSTNRFIEAYYNVRIFSDSLQAVGDSMFYSLEDSAFRLFKNPVVWAKENQITGDTIYLFTANKKPKRLYVFENALAVNKSDQFFNQVKGNTINGNFIDGDINHIRAKGSAENIYYAADDQNNYIGVNRSTCDIIDMYFLNRKPKKIVFRNNLEGTTFPMKQVSHSTMRLRGFKWLEDRRPKTKADLFGN